MELKLTFREAVTICNINLKTAFFWRHRFITAQTENYPDKLSGIIEVDEFFLAYSEKGSKKLTEERVARKRGGNIDKRTKDGQVAVLLSTDRSNHMFDGVLSEDTAYVKISRTTNCEHKRLVSGKNRVIDKIYHIQTVNGAIAHFKGWIDGKCEVLQQSICRII